MNPIARPKCVHIFISSLSMALAGCVVDGVRMKEAGIEGPALELTQTAFFPDDRLQAAPSALATVLYTDGVVVGPDEVMPVLPSDGGQRPLQGDLVAATRSFDRVPTLLPASYGALMNELRAGRPVMVLLAMPSDDPGATGMPPSVPRYAVVVGVQPSQDRILLRAGTAGRLVMDFDAFDSAWRGSRRWAMVVTRPDELPPSADPVNWTAGADAAVAAKKPALAEAMIATANGKWGESAAGWIASGNVRYAMRDLGGAGTAYRKAIAMDAGNSVAHNNLAEVLLDRHCVDAAQAEIDAALQAETDPQLRERYEGTQVMIRRHDGPSIYCPDTDDGAGGAGRYEGTPVELDVMPERRVRHARKARKSS